jgi:hypothetical protein
MLYLLSRLFCVLLLFSIKEEHEFLVMHIPVHTRFTGFIPLSQVCHPVHAVGLSYADVLIHRIRVSESAIIFVKFFSFKSCHVIKSNLSFVCRLSRLYADDFGC